MTTTVQDEYTAFVLWLQCNDETPPESSNANLAQVATAIAPLHGQERVKLCEIQLNSLNGDGPATWERLAQAMAELDAPEPPQVDTEPDVPELPESAQIDPGPGAFAGRWVDVYADHADAISPMTPRAFHESAALWLGSVAIGRRLKLSMAFGDVYPNLFIVWLAVTTLYRKSTALDVARKAARAVFPHLMAAQDTTPEAFLSDLAGREPAQLDAMTDEDRESWQNGRHFAAQKGWLLDEMSGLMAASGRDYNAGLVESLLRFYDCDPYYVRSTRGQGRVVVRNSYLSMLSASTPAAMSTHLVAERLWSMGWWPRFAVLTPPADRPAWREAREHDEPAELCKGLERLYKRLPEASWPDPPRALTMTLGADVFDTWRRYSKALSYDLLTDELDTRLHGTYGRLPTHALKVAMILAALDWPKDTNAPRIELAHLARAVTICEEWRASAHRALALVTTTEYEKLRLQILKQVSKREPEGVSMRDLGRSMRSVEPGELREAIAQMIELGDLEANETRPGPKGGRKTIRYSLARG